MKKSELRRLVAEHKEIKLKLLKTNNDKLKSKLSQIEHMYYHETGSMLELDPEEFT